MKRFLLSGLALLLTTLIAGTEPAVDKIQVAVFTGGHEFDPAFWTLFEGYDDLEITRLEQPKANEIFTSDAVKKFDVLVFYDLNKEISREQQNGFMAYLKEGKGIVALHHSLVSYTDWPDWWDIIGGHYVTTAKPQMINEKPYGPSVATAGQELKVKITNKKHPVTKGISDFSIVDELYGNVYVAADVHPLLETNFAKSMKYLAWTKKYENSKVVYIELGHDNKAYAKPEFRKLVYQAITWAAKPDKPVINVEQEKEKAIILALMKEMDEKWSKGDYAVYLNSFADNGSTFGWTDQGLSLFKLTPEGKLKTLAEVESWAKKGYKEILLAREIDFQWLSKTSALITCIVRSDMVEPESKDNLIQDFRATRIFVNEDGQWKLFHEHFSPITVADQYSPAEPSEN